MPSVVQGFVVQGFGFGFGFDFDFDFGLGFGLDFGLDSGFGLALASCHLLIANCLADC